MRKKFAKAAIALSLAAVMTATSIPVTALADENYGDMIELDCPEIYPESKLEDISDMEISTKVEALLATMTEDEIYSMLGGASTASSARGYGTGYVAGVARLGIPVIRMWDGPKGVISNYKLETTSPASELALASSFSEEMAYEYGKLTGIEDKITAANCQLGAQLDLVRAPFFRRSRDSMGEDAYLTSKLGYELSKGIQDQNVITTLKHLACYSETASGRNANVQVDEQTLHEMYLAPYEYIIKNKGASAVMTSYNGVNGYNTCSNTYLLKTVLRDMWGFSGLVMTDWGGNYEFTTDKGVDLETGTLNRNNKANIEAAIAAGTMTWDDALNAVRHTLTAMGEVGYLGLVEVKQNGTAAEDPNPPATIELSTVEGEERTAILEENDKIALESAVKGSVLLKNDNEALPVSETDSIAMIGLLADHSLSHISESSWGWLQKMTGAYTEIKEILGENAKITEAVGLDTIGEPVAAEYLYTTEDCTENGVSVSITTDENTENKIMSNIRLTTGTIDGKTNRTYKNSEDGTALVNGQTAVMTTYLKAPETGTYEFEVQKIGGEARVNIITEEADESGAVVEKENSISGSGSTGGGRGTTGASSWPSTGAVPTEEGMDVPTSTTKLNLEAGKVYKITVTAAGKIDEKDLQMSLNWFKPGDRDAQYQAALEAARTNKKVIYFGYDKGETRNTNTNSMDLPSDQEKLLEDVIAVAKENGNQVIVVLNAALPVTMDWVDDVDAVLQMWLSGQSGGKAAAQLLTGEENPSGKLPVSWPKSINDTQYGEFATGYTTEAQNNLDYYNGGEGIFSGYRWYDKAGIDPLYAFGYGLSYTTFDYSDLSVAKAADDTGYDVTFTITNTGSVTGSEVAEVYLGKAEVPDDVQMAEKKLAAFARVEDLKPGESKKVTVKVDARELSYWDTEKEVEVGTEKWTVAEGERDFYVSKSSDSDDIVLRTSVDVKDVQFTPNQNKPDNNNGNDELAKAAAEAAKQAAEAAKAAQAAAEAAKEAAEASKDAVENQAAMIEVANQAQAAANAAAEAAKAAQDAAEKAQTAVADQAAQANAAEQAAKAAEAAQKAAEAAQKAAEEQTAQAEAVAEAVKQAAEAAKAAAEAAVEAANKQTADAIAKAEEAEKKAAQALEVAEAAQKAAKAAEESAKAAQEAAEKQTAAAKAEAEAAKKEAANAQAELKTLSEKLNFTMKEVEVKKVKSTSKKKASVSWKKVSGANGYVVQYAKKSSMKSAKKVTVTKGTAKNKTIKNLKSKTRYFVRVRAYKNIGGTKVYTAYSPISSVKVK